MWSANVYLPCPILSRNRESSSRVRENTVSISPSDAKGGSHDVVQTDLRLTKLLPPLPVCCNYRTLRVQDSRVTCQRPKISISFGFLSACSPRDLLRPSPQMGYRERRLKLHSSGQRQHGLSQTWKFLDRDRQSAVLQTQRKRWLPLCL